MVTGGQDEARRRLARALESTLVASGHEAYWVDGRNIYLGVDADIAFDNLPELVRRYGEVLHLLLSAGLLVISTTKVIGPAQSREIETHLSPFPLLVVHLGKEAEGCPDGADLRADPDANPEKTVARVLGKMAVLDLIRRDGSEI